MKVIDRYGKEQLCKFIIDNNVMTVIDKDDPQKIIMRLKRIKDEE